MRTKRCSRCQRFKLLREFSILRRHRSGRRSECRECRHKLWNENKARINALRHERYAEAHKGLPDRRRKQGGAFDRDSRSHLLQAYLNMQYLCRNTGKYEHLYQGRHIRVCKAWQTFEGFKRWALQNDYQPGLYLVRRSKFKNYQPSNCLFDSYKRRVPVVCVELGLSFPTILSAELAMEPDHRPTGALSAAVRHGYRYCGFHWKRLPLKTDTRKVRPVQTVAQAKYPRKELSAQPEPATS